MKSITKSHLLILSSLFIFSCLHAQEKMNFSLKEAINYGLTHKASNLNAQLDIEIANSKVKEIISSGLPQISGSMMVSDNFLLQKVIVPPGPINPTDKSIALAFQPNYSGQAAINATQLLFSGSYLVGLKATVTYRDLMKKMADQTEIKTIENITKAYYGVLVNRERLKLLDANIKRLDSTLFEMKALFENGFIEKLDLDRIKVSKNNLSAEKEKIYRLVEVTEYVLIFQMGLPLDTKINLTDKLDEQIAKAKMPVNAKPEFSNRVEYQLLQLQKTSSELELKNIRSGYLPTASLFLNRGSLAGNNSFSDFLSVSKSWFGFGAYGINLSMPIWDSFQRKHKAQQSKLAIQKTQNTIYDFENVAWLQGIQSLAMYKNSLSTVQIQQENLSLAKSILSVTKTKYKEGVGSNLEVVNAETSLKESETNYFGAIYDLLITKVDYEISQGILTK